MRKLRSKFTTIAASLMVFLAMPICNTASASIIDLSFSGSYNIMGGSVFGESGAAVPFSYTIRYDTDLDTDANFVATGQLMGGNITTHDWYGYSASGIVSSDITFGTETWAVADINPITPAIGVSSDFWLDADIGTTSPTRAWISFSNTMGDLQIGGGSSDAINIYLSISSDVNQSMSPGAFPGFAYSDSVSIDARPANVPEPNTLFLLLPGLALLALGRRAKD